jgi:hypothetical protein
VHVLQTVKRGFVLEETAERIGFEDSRKLGCERGGRRRIQVARAVYKDANAVYDALFRERPKATLWEEEVVDSPPKEVGCYSHCRRNF